MVASLFLPSLDPSRRSFFSRIPYMVAAGNHEVFLFPYCTSRNFNDIVHVPF